MTKLQYLVCSALLAVSVSVPALEPEDVADILGPYVGNWQTDRVHESRDGREFRYRYDLEWFDGARTITRMTITRVFADGERLLAWEGFKGFNPPDGGLFYYGFSPSARTSRGDVHRADDGTLVTEYTGYSLDGSPVEIRDEFTPVIDDRFRSVTTLRRTPADDWREIGRETWVRVDSSIAQAPAGARW